METDYHFGVAVGIDRYPGYRRGETDRDLLYACSDANAFYDWMRGPGNLTEANTSLLTFTEDEVGSSPIDAKPRCAHIYEAIKGFKDHMEDVGGDDPDAWERSRLYFYVSGHGFASSSNDVALLTADAQHQVWPHVSCRKLIEHFQSTQSFREVIVFADCCRDRVPAVAPSGPPWATPNRNPGGGIEDVLGFAAEYGRRAYEPGLNADEQRGYFTQALLEGLGGHTRLKASDPVKMSTLDDYLRLRVPELTKGKRGVVPQSPKLTGSPGLVLVPKERLPPVKKFQVTLKFQEAPPVPLGIFIGGEKKEERATPLAADEPWKIRLHKGLYEVRRPDGSEIPGWNGKDSFMVFREGHDVKL